MSQRSYPHRRTHKVSIFIRRQAKTEPMQRAYNHDTALDDITSPTRVSLRTWERNGKTVPQPPLCDLQPKMQKHRLTRRAQTHKHTHAKSNLKPYRQSGTNHMLNRSYPHLPHIRCTFLRRPKPIDPKKCKVSCQNYIPEQFFVI